ncbi:MAG: DUF1211 domain-containing protein [Caldilinea sp. CFX5]|nr:DUF1211 domain-containing protein [Caldilinea sp. CFX5]
MTTPIDAGVGQPTEVTSTGKLILRKKYVAPQRSQLPPSETKEGDLAFERIVFFSDAVFAIAITLLVIEIRVPELKDALVDEQLSAALWALWPKLLSYGISFTVIAAYWVAHHSLFRFVKRFDQALIWLNLLFLFFVALTPFPTAVVGEYGNHAAAQIFYAGSVVLTGVAHLMLWWYVAYHQYLLAETVDTDLLRQKTRRALVTPVVFLLSIPTTAFGPIVPVVLWVLTPLLYWLVERL